MSDHDSLAAGLAKFAELVARRLERNVYTTEDAVRYTMFHALAVTYDLQPEDIILEHDHRTIARAKVDTWIPSFIGRSYALEFKYDRAIPSQANSPRPQKAGHVLKDIFRLARLHADDAVVSVFVYLTSTEMARYLVAPANGLSDLFDLKAGVSLPINAQFLVGRSNTLRAVAGEIVSCDVSILLSCSLPHEHELRIYQIRS